MSRAGLPFHLIVGVTCGVPTQTDNLSWGSVRVEGTAKISPACPVITPLPLPGTTIPWVGYINGNFVYDDWRFKQKPQPMVIHICRSWNTYVSTSDTINGLSQVSSGTGKKGRILGDLNSFDFPM